MPSLLRAAPQELKTASTCATLFIIGQMLQLCIDTKQIDNSEDLSTKRNCTEPDVIEPCALALTRQSMGQIILQTG
ncbi:hypothetical protein [uncultured Roseobacter sp.]|uniref:hypothetical protein n=1 Tax=uncultured Roseobacter sp. TaxID=114847 RepID=UPI002619B825|nr:hypothetical protein [uncultured Roseobacter sp.]